MQRNDRVSRSFEQQDQHGGLKNPWGNHSPVLVLVLLVNATHEGGSRRQDLVDKDEDGLLRGQLDPLTDHVDELAYGEICRYKVLLLIDSRNVALLDFLADDLERTEIR